MAEQIAQDPAFAQMTAALQASMAGGEGVQEEAGTEREVGASAGPHGPPMDADKYAAALGNVLQNQSFMEMAEKLGQQIMSVRSSPPSGNVEASSRKSTLEAGASRLP